MKIARIVANTGASGSSRQFLMDLLGLTPSELQCWAAAQKVPGTYGKGLNCLFSGPELEEQFSPR